MTESTIRSPRLPWRARAGNHLMWDTIGASQISLLVLFFGLRERHKLLEIGAGTLRAARFLIPNLDVGNYCGVEPKEQSVELGIRHELGEEMAARKQPRFSTREDFVFDEFGEKFDYALSYSVLTHTAPPQVTKFFEGLAPVMHDQSIALVTAAVAPEERIVDPEKWTALPVNYYSEARITDEAARVGLRVERLGQVFQDWFVAFKEPNPIATAGSRAMRAVQWWTVTPQWEDPGWSR